MDPFVDIFFAIDENQSDIITTDELRRYVDKHHLDSGMIKKWQNLFDPQNTGRITFAKFCEVLGIKPETVRLQRSQRQIVSSAPKLDTDVKIIFHKMNSSDQARIIDEARRLSKPAENFDQRYAVEQLKKWLDQTYGRFWHVTIVKGSYWTSYSYTTDSTFHFILNGHSYVIWRTQN